MLSQVCGMNELALASSSKQVKCHDYIIPSLRVSWVINVCVCLPYAVLPSYAVASLGMELGVTEARAARVRGAKSLAHPCRLVGLDGVEV